MSVDTFDPAASPQALGRADLAVLLQAASEQSPPFGLSAHEVARFARLVRQDAVDWRLAAQQLSNAELESLIRLLVVAEGELVGWDSGAKSPVIPLAAALKERQAYPEDLTPWIKAHSRNRFLPYGSLLDRL